MTKSRAMMRRCGLDCSKKIRAQNGCMDLRRHRRTVRGSAYEYWTLVESRRTASGPRRHTLATLGKLPGLDERVRAG